MQLTKQTDYALRLLMLLAAEPDTIHTAEEVARRYGISRDHLMKVAQRLSRAGFVASIRGRHGGLKLKGAAAMINLGAVVRSMEDNLALVECFDVERNACVITSACRLRSALREASQAFQAALDRVSLADLTGDASARLRMVRLLHDPSQGVPA